MCLNIKPLSFKKFALRDIPCIKVLSQCKFTGNLQTPYRECPVTIGDTYTSELVRKGNNIEEGLHSLHKNSRTKWIEYECDNKSVIVECIIPRGSFYFVGKYNGEVSYASNKLKYVKIKS